MTFFTVIYLIRLHTFGLSEILTRFSLKTNILFIWKKHAHNMSKYDLSSFMFKSHDHIPATKMLGVSFQLIYEPELC